MFYLRKVSFANTLVDTYSPFAGDSNKMEKLKRYSQSDGIFHLCCPLRSRQLLILVQICVDFRLRYELWFVIDATIWNNLACIKATDLANICSPEEIH